jgi:hypothetical protein
MILRVFFVNSVTLWLAYVIVIQWRTHATARG